MKQSRRRSHLRPRPTRSQINQQIRHIQANLQVFQLEWLLEASQQQPRLPRLQFLRDAIVAMKDEIASLEQF